MSKVFYKATTIRVFETEDEFMTWFRKFGPGMRFGGFQKWEQEKILKEGRYKIEDQEIGVSGTRTHMILTRGRSMSRDRVTHQMKPEQDLQAKRIEYLEVQLAAAQGNIKHLLSEVQKIEAAFWRIDLLVDRGARLATVVQVKQIVKRILGRKQ